MSLNLTPENTTQAIELLGWLLFFASEGIAMSPLKQNYVLQLVLHMAQELFPYEVRRRESPNRRNRPRWRRSKGQ